MKNYKEAVKEFSSIMESYKVVGKGITTVGQLRRLLEKLPDNYNISLEGIIGTAVAKSDEDKIILFDDERFMEDAGFTEELL